MRLLVDLAGWEFLGGWLGLVGSLGRLVGKLERTGLSELDGWLDSNGKVWLSHLRELRTQVFVKLERKELLGTAEWVPETSVHLAEMISERRSLSEL